MWVKNLFSRRLRSIIPIPGLNEVKAHESETDAVDRQSMRRSNGEVQRKDHFKHGMGISCFLLGAAMPFSFAPFHWFPLAWILPAFLIRLCLNVSAKVAGIYGLCFGFGWALVGGSWIFVSIHEYGGQSALVTAGIVVLCAALLSLYIAFTMGMWAFCFPKTRPSKVLLAFPAVWTLWELLRGWLFTGVPWLLVGNSQTDSLLAGYAPLLGVYGVTWLTALCSGLFVCALCPRAVWVHKGFETREIRQVVYLCLIGLLSLMGVGAALSKIAWTSPAAKPVSVSLVQGNITPQTKWDPAVAETSFLTYIRLTDAHWSRWVIWPETSVSWFANEASSALSILSQEAIRHQTAMVLGIPLQDGAGHFYNGAIALGEGQGVYRKHHLVPFGEYVPLSQWLGSILQFLDLPMSSFSAGDLKQPLIHLNGIPVAVLICYEGAFPFQVREQLQNAQALILLSDDGWFGHSLGPAQHEQIDQMRALETGRFLLRATNDGMTSVINPQGQIQAALAPHAEGVLTTEITPLKGQTPWIFWGAWPVYGIILLSVLWARRSQKK